MVTAKVRDSITELTELSIAWLASCDHIPIVIDEEEVARADVVEGDAERSEPEGAANDTSRERA